jgi:hypothetical protein
VVKTMKLRFFLPVALALVLLVAACVPPLNLRNDKFLQDDSLLTNDPCEAPCWRGITPGVTEWSEALTILEDATDINDPQVQTGDDGILVGAQWQPVDGDACCQMISEQGEIVDLIVVWQKPDKTVGDLIEVRGEPTYVIGTPGDETQAIVSLFYPDNALIVIAFVAGANADLNAGSEVVGAYYLTPERMQLILDTSSLFAWDGYQPFSSYNAEAEGAEFAITPSVTLTPTATQ